MQPDLIFDINELKAVFSLFCRFLKENYIDGAERDFFICHF